VRIVITAGPLFTPVKTTCGCFLSPLGTAPSETRWCIVLCDGVELYTM